MQMSDTQTSFIQMAFYGAYFCLALPAALFIRRYSFKSGVILGLVLYAAGAVLFLPAAWTESYAFYLIAIYILASGCSVLETTANPYIMSMGSPETATRRLNIAQSFNPMGSILGILVSKYFILKDISLYSVSGTYAAVGVVLIAIMVVMLFARMPEGQDTAKQDSLSATFKRLLKKRKYSFGVIAQFFYVGAQICVWSFTIRLVMSELDMVEAQAATIYLISIIGFCASRFVYTWLMKYVAPRRLLLVGAMLSAVSAIVVVLAHGWTCVTALMLVSVFMSLMFPTIYGLALEGIENPENGGCAGDAKIGASGLIMAILGGALLTPLQGLVSDNSNINMSYIVPAACFIVVLLYSMSVMDTTQAANN
ncbi:MAG: sugar MFS transporter, partial [Bacteroidales bacterium]|nr:sugar MFS transporter [Bacteroidales bacterium]